MTIKNDEQQTGLAVPVSELPATDLSRRKTLSTLGWASVLGATGLISAPSFAQRGRPGRSSSSVSSSSLSSASSSLASSSASSTSGSCVLIPTETIGPYPLATFLDNSSVLRENIAEDRTGVPLQLKLKLVNVNNSCTPVSGYVYVWHCDKDGNYSGYNGEANKTYCRGVQYTDGNGVASFTSIYPGWYSGRITHIHFQVFLSNYGSNSSSTAISQLAFPAEITTAVYNSALYTKGQNTSVTSFAADGIFSDGVSYQLASVSGNVNDGYVAELTVGIAL